MKSFKTYIEESMTGYHGSTYDFDRFSTDFMGTGEGYQAFGWGIYVGEVPAVGEYYRDMFTKLHKGTLDSHRDFINYWAKKSSRPDTAEHVAKMKKEIEDIETRKLHIGALYKVRLDVNKETDMLDWNHPQTNPTVIEKLERAGIPFPEKTGEIIYKWLAKEKGNPKEASMFLDKHGIKGIYYFDKFSKGPAANDKSHNLVIFNDKNISIVEKGEFRNGKFVAKK